MDGYRFEPFVSSQLPSGLTVISARRPGSRVISAGVFFGVGAAHETKEQSGWSHLLEHLHLSNDAVDPAARKRIEALFALGARFNASTGLEYTSYTVEVASRYWSRVGRLVSNAIAHPALREDAVDRERRIVEQEMAARNNSSSRLAPTVQSGIFAGTPFAKWTSEVGGTPEGLSGSNMTNLADWRERGYVAGNAWVVVSGDISHESAIEFAMGLNLAPGYLLPYPSGKWDPVAGTVHITSATTPQTSLVLSWPTVAAGDHVSTALAIIERHLGGSSTSRLFSELRTVRGLTYEPLIEHIQYPGVGAMQMWTETMGQRNADEAADVAIELICEGWRGLRLIDVRRRVREMLGVYERVTDAPSSVVAMIGEQFSPLRRLQQPDDYAARIRAVTLDEVVDTWRRYLREDRVFVVREN